MISLFKKPVKKKKHSDVEKAREENERVITIFKSDIQFSMDRALSKFERELRR